jgi:hypothetical protein
VKLKCPYCGTVMGCIECAGFMCEGCGADLSCRILTPVEPLVCKFDHSKPMYTLEDNDNDTEELWDD